MLVLQPAPPSLSSPDAIVASAQAVGSGSQSMMITGDAAFLIALRTLISRSLYAEAARLLQAAPPDVRSQPPVLYLEAQLDRRQGRRLAAIDLYNRLLTGASAPQLVRLELAQTYFEIGDDRAAEQWFRLALSGPLPPGDAVQAHAYLEAIRKRGGWRVTTGVSLAPDSNLNDATSATAVTLFGLPFDLNDQARSKSGVSEGVSASAERSIPIGGAYRAEFQAYGSFINDPGRAFDQAVAGLRAGPQRVPGETVVSLLGGYEQAYYGEATLYRAKSLTLRADYPGVSKTLYNTSAVLQRLDYPHLPDYAAWNAALGVQRTRYLDPGSFWRLSLRAGYNRADASYQSYRAGIAAVGYYHVLPLGLAAYAEAGAGVNDYAAPLPLFGVRRRDLTELLSVQLAFRARTFAGFAPYVGVTDQHVQSNVALYRYKRLRAELGITRAF